MAEGPRRAQPTRKSGKRRRDVRRCGQAVPRLHATAPCHGRWRVPGNGRVAAMVPTAQPANSHCQHLLMDGEGGRRAAQRRRSQDHDACPAFWREASAAHGSKSRPAKHDTGAVPADLSDPASEVAALARLGASPLRPRKQELRTPLAAAATTLSGRRMPPACARGLTAARPAALPISAARRGSASSGRLPAALLAVLRRPADARSAHHLLPAARAAAGSAAKPHLVLHPIVCLGDDQEMHARAAVGPLSSGANAGALSGREWRAWRRRGSIDERGADFARAAADAL
jgi:hypothetical protein